MSIIRKQAPAWKTDALVAGGDFKSVSSSDFAGKYYVLVFYPADFTFVCPTELIAYSDRAAEFEALGATVMGVSVDTKFVHKAWTETPRNKGGLGTSFKMPLLSDVTKSISKSFGVLVEDPADPDAGLALRATIIVDPKGVVRSLTVNDLPVGRNVDETLRVLEAFKYVEEHGDEVCPAGWKKGAKTMKPTFEGVAAYLGASA